MSSLNRFLDQIAQLRMGNSGNTLAHTFLEDVAQSPLRSVDEAGWSGGRNSHHKRCIFMPPKEQDRIIVFSDNSAVYVHHDGFCTILSSNCAEEMTRSIASGTWRELDQHGQFIHLNPSLGISTTGVQRHGTKKEEK